MVIPPQLQNSNFRFVLINHKEKNPFEKNWPNTANYTFNDPKLLNWIPKGNYGVIGGFANLIILDFDDMNYYEQKKDCLPETLTIKTGSNKLHKYYFCDDTSSFKITDSKGKTLTDIQGRGKLVVGSGSTHPNGNKYLVLEDKPIAQIKKKNLQYIFNDFAKDKDKYKATHPEGNEAELIKKKVSLTDLLNDYGYDIRRNPTMCKLGHDSVSKTCFSFDTKEDIWHCFNCEMGGDIFNLVMEHDHCDFIKALEKLRAIAGLEKPVYSKAPAQLKVTNYLENVRAFYQNQPFFYDENGIFWFWDLGRKCYDRKDDTHLLKTISEQLEMNGDLVQSGTKQAYLEMFRQFGRGKIPKESPRWWVQFKDKIFDVETKQTFSASPDYFICNPIPWRIGDSESTPVLDKLFTEWVGVEYVSTLYEILAYSTLPDYPLHLIFCFCGSGRNGKSTFLSILNNFVGARNTCSTDLDLLAESRFESGKLYKKLICTMGETNFGTLQKTSLLKRLTGQDQVGMEFKNKMPFDTVSYAKLIVSTNSLPASEDTSEGFYRRWMIIDFPNNFPEGKDILKNLPLVEYEALAARCLKVLPGLLARGKFAQQGSIEERRHKYELTSNPLPSFIIKYYDRKDPNGFERYSEMYANYVKYLTQIKRRVVSRKEFTSALVKEGLEIRRTNKKIGETFQNDQWVEGVTFNKGIVTIVGDVGVVTKFPTSFPYREKSCENRYNSHNSHNFNELSVIEHIDRVWKICLRDYGIPVSIENLHAFGVTDTISIEDIDNWLQKKKDNQEIVEIKPARYIEL